MRFVTLCLSATILAFCNAAGKDCYYADLFCESCTSLVRCTEDENGNFTKEEIGTCRLPEKCINGACTEDSEPICDRVADATFPCQSVGLFPHPFYCDKFVLCVAGTVTDFRPYVTQCEAGYGYNIQTYECDIPIEANQCKELEYPVPLCGSLGETGALEGNPTFYYTCEEIEFNIFDKTIYPILRRCPHGQVYGDDFTCQ